MATTLLPNRTHLRVHSAAFSSPVRPGPLRSVLPGASRQQQLHRVGLPQQKQQLLPRPIGPAGLLLPGTALSPANARQTTIMRSFLGVGAPEAILVAVVALVVFGPKGLADAAKSLGQTLRAFQPTIKEVVEVSQEIKGTLEQELGLDELRNAANMRPTPRPIQSDTTTSSSSSIGPTSSSSSDASAGGTEASSSGSGTNPPTLRAISEDMAVQLDPDIELKRAMSEQAAWGGQAPVASTGTAAAAAAGSGGEGKAAQGTAGKDLSTLSLEELEAELERRRRAASP